MKLKLVAFVDKKSVNDPMNPVNMNLENKKPFNPHIMNKEEGEKLVKKDTKSLLTKKFCVFNYKNILVDCYDTREEADQKVIDYRHATGFDSYVVEGK